ncbi:bacillithiol biosynthesis cysteine-adding enzyme BshC [Balneolaceae bacterium ANBcel3]|nr:bacillithiol biosynthesis cysteine-adding enzyme BshC [Balneolaceae bacterium ANBcel3]
MKTRKEPLHTFPYPAFFLDYIRSDGKAASYFQHRHTYKELCKKVEKYHYPHDRADMASILKDINRPFLPETSLKERCNLLLDPDTVTLTTGQQTTLLGGTGLTLYKLISTIVLSERLSKDTSRNVLPVFWLADEDHDIEEISSVGYVHGEAFVNHTLQYNSDNVPHAVSNLKIPEEPFDTFLDAFFSSLPETDFTAALLKIVRDSYRKGTTYDEAFASLLSRLFAGYPILFAKSNHRKVKSFCKPVLSAAIAKATELKASLEEQTAVISKHYKQQATVTDSLLFYHDPEKGRLKLNQSNGQWSVDHGRIQWDQKELLDISEEKPWLLSPNVFLRPILQDYILPNVAYIGGPAEIAYHAQMATIYSFFDQKMPFLTGRLTATVIEPGTRRNMDRLPFHPTDYLTRLEDLEQTYLRNNDSKQVEECFSNWKNDLAKMNDEMADTRCFDDDGLKKQAGAMMRQFEKSMDKLQQKVLQGQRKKEETALNRISRVRQSLYPENQLQERKVAFLYYLNKYGVDFYSEWIEHFVQSEDPLFTNHFLIEPLSGKNE